MSDADQAEMVGYTVWRGSLCEGCGIKADLGMDPSNTFNVEDETCWSCWAKEYRRVQLAKASGDKDAKLDPQAGKKVWVSGTKPHKHLREVPNG